METRLVQRALVIGIAGVALLGAQPGASSDANGNPITTSTEGVRPAATPSTGGPAGRPIFLTGTVMMDDGSHVPPNVTIQSACGLVTHIMTNSVSATGSFGFRWTNATDAFGDASQNPRDPASGGRSQGRGVDQITNCELLAASSGYTSSKVSLFDSGGQDNFDVGTIILHHTTPESGHAVSVMALAAPKGAKKTFDKGVNLAAQGKFVEAVASFQKAIEIYPRYPDAWLRLGKVQLRVGRKEEAQESFRKSMELDKKLVGPWQELGFAACDDSRWEDAVRYLDEAIHLDPIGSSLPWYFDALANYNLGKLPQAERSVRTALRMDHGRNPQGEYLLGIVLIAREDMRGGAEALRTFIAAAPRSADLRGAKRELSRAEQQIGR